MDMMAFRQLKTAVTSSTTTEETVEYLSDLLGRFLRPQEKIMICFPMEGDGCIGDLLSRAAQKVGAVPFALGEDVRWKTILRLAFTSRATAIAAPPLVMLGLTKLAKLTKTPLYFHNVVTAGYFCMDWMIEGIRRGLDCQMWGFYDIGDGSVIAGRSCGVSHGVHVRQDMFTCDIVDDAGAPVEEGQIGNVLLGLRSNPAICYDTRDRARLVTAPCQCGQAAPRLMDIGPGRDVDMLLLELGAQYHTWGSILDCRVSRGTGGLELELITFPGEKLPQMPSVARLVVRAWDPDKDVPNWFQAEWRMSSENG